MTATQREVLRRTITLPADLHLAVAALARRDVVDSVQCWLVLLLQRLVEEQKSA